MVPTMGEGGTIEAMAPPAPGRIRVLPLGGLGRIGGNMMVYETAAGLIVVDCGVNFPGPDEPGVDWVLPDNAYLIAHSERVLAYVITHGHEDHIGAIPFLWPDAPAPIYATGFTASLLERKLKEHRMWDDIELHLIRDRASFEIGDMNITPLPVTHSIPDAVALAIRAQGNLVVHTGDFKVDPQPPDGRTIASKEFETLGDEGVDLLLSDSTNATREGSTESETVVGRALLEVMKQAEGRLAVTTFSSNIFRLASIIKAAESCGRRVMLCGRSVENYTNSARALGHLKVDDALFVDRRRFNELEPSEIAMIVSGCQGEDRSALGRISMGRYGARLEEGDTLIMSSRKIPGNELAIAKVMRRFLRMGVKVVTANDAPIHTSGHAYRDEQRQMVAWCKPRFMVPMHGELVHMQAHAGLAEDGGARAVKLEDGAGIELCADSNPTNPERIRRLPPIPLASRLRDGHEDVESIVLRDRLRLRDSGFVSCVVVLQNGKPMLSPQLQSRGVFWLDENEELLSWAELEVEKIFERKRKPKSPEAFEEEIRNTLSRFFQRELGRKPMVVSQVVEC